MPGHCWTLAWATGVATLLIGCGRSETNEDQAAVSPVGPPAVVLAEIAAWQALGGKIDLRDLATPPAAPGARNAADLHKPGASEQPVVPTSVGSGSARISGRF